MKKNIEELRSKGRVVYMDIVKALAIILVVVGHTDSPIQNFIYLFHVAVFFCVSGYFYKDSYSSQPIQLIVKRLKTLYIPFVLYELIFLAFHNIFYYLNIYSSKVVYFGEAGYVYKSFDYIKNIFLILTFHNTEQLLKPFWFLIVLFVINVFFAFISYVSNRINPKRSEVIRFLAISICFLVGIVLSYFKIVLSLNTNIALVAVLIFYFGYLYKKYEYQIPFTIYYFLASFVLLIISSFYVHIEMSSNAYSNPFYFIVDSLLGIYFIFGIAKFVSLKKGKWLDVLTYIGVNTIPILALQLLCFKLVSFIEVLLYKYPIYMTAKFLILDGSYGWWAAYSIVGICMPLFVVYLSQKIIHWIKKRYAEMYIIDFIKLQTGKRV